MNGVVGGGVPARLWRRFMLEALAQDGAGDRPRTARPQADAIGDLVESVAGPDAGDAAGALTDVIIDAEQGEVDSAAVADAAARVEEAIGTSAEPPPAAAPPPQ